VDPAGERHCNSIGHAGANVVVIQPDTVSDDSLSSFAVFLDGIREIHRPEWRLVGRRIEAELLHPDPFSAMALEGLALELLTQSARVRDGAPTRVPPVWLKRAEEMIRSRFTEPLSVADVARECSVHPTHLARVFRRHHRSSLGEFLRRCRLEWAADQLASSRDPIALIAVRAGFSDQSHFTNRFREQMGATPGQWRRIHSA
jgi:AraC family transcriptional regulator